ncbi:hypothetical protein C8Q72DRAFT_836940 [Fomitopsis betulina]|nr:hypothetical protein C8Q72DRAFT_836940 [Fomitopsis betulina]
MEKTYCTQTATAYAHDGHKLALELWPKHLRAYLRNYPSLATLPSWAKIPVMFWELFDWADVLTRSDDEASDVFELHQVMLIHKHIPLLPRPPTSIAFAQSPIVISVIGFVADCVLHAVGNWSGRSEHAAYAHQLIALEHGGFIEPFRVQGVALTNLNRFVRTKFFKRACRAPMITNVAEFRRYPFDAVDSDTQRPSVITPADRHYSEARSIEDVWRVTDRLPIWRRECNRVLTPCAPSKIRKGGFC